MNVGENIKKIRKEKGITQKELGERLGVSQAAIGQFENDNSNLKMETIKKIANALDVEYTRLIIETPFTNGSIEERQKMSDEELAEYLTYLITNDKNQKQGILERIQDRKVKILTEHFIKLNSHGQNKAIEDVENLTYNPKYRKSELDNDFDTE